MTQTATKTVDFVSRYSNKLYVVGGTGPGINTGFHRIEFIDGKYSTDDPEIIDWLTTHHDFNLEIWRADSPGAFIPGDYSTKVTGGVSNTKSVAERPRERGRFVPRADNMVEAEDTAEAESTE